MRTYTTMQDLTADLENILASSEGEYDLEAIAYEVARTESEGRLNPVYYITEDEDEFWTAVMAHALD